MHAEWLDRIRGIHRIHLDGTEWVDGDITYFLDQTEADEARQLVLAINDGDHGEAFKYDFTQALEAALAYDPDANKDWLEKTPHLADSLLHQLEQPWNVESWTQLEKDDPRAIALCAEAARIIREDPQSIARPVLVRMSDWDPYPARVLRAAARVMIRDPAATPNEALRRAGFLRT